LKIFRKYEIGLLKYLTIKRIINITKVLFSYFLSNLTSKVIVWGKPYSATIEPTNFCNLKCPECPSGLGRLTRPLGIINLIDFENYCKEISETVFYLQLFFQGEPLVNKNLPELVGIAHKYNMYVAISTNGILVTETVAQMLIASKIDKVIFSIDGLDENTYQNYRVGGTFEKAFKGLKNLLNEKIAQNCKYPYIEFQFIVMKQNEHQIPQILELSKLDGLNKVTLKTMQVYSKQSAEYFLPSNPKYRRYIIDSSGELKIKGKFKNKCYAIWRTAVITWDGNIVSCCFDKDANFIMGNLKENNFPSIWKNQKFTNFRKAIMTNRSKIPMCKNCTEGVKINID